MNSTLKRQKSVSSQAASISAWCAVFDWPSIVAAFTVERHGPASSSAARRKIAARSSHGVWAQSWRASRAAAIACSTSAGPPEWTSASTWFLRCGITASKDSVVLTSLRSEEYTSELQSHLNLVCRLLLEKKNKCHHHSYISHTQ